MRQMIKQHQHTVCLHTEGTPAGIHRQPLTNEQDRRRRMRLDESLLIKHIYNLFML